MKLRFFAPLAALSLAVVGSTSDARACGGCFHPPVITQGGATVVTGHRMAFSTSPVQSVLWDSIQYAGDPKEFAWVLPINHGAVVEESTDAWFETLDAATTAQISSPTLVCPDVTAPSGGCGFSSASSGVADFAEGSSGAGGGAGGPPPVQVLHQGTVGPYETVTLASTQPGALNAWLTMHGYNVDADIQPIIDAYVKEGFDFIALRLLPDKGIREMKPVRVVSPGAGVTLPLRMVAAGTGADVAITLFTITEGRLAVDQYKNEVVSPDSLVWDFKAQSSNYTSVRKDILSKNSGFTFITAYAQKGAMLSPVITPGFNTPSFGFAGDGSFQTIDTIASAYVNQGLSNGETMDTSCNATLSAIADSGALVVDPCPAGAMPNDPACTTVSADQVDSRSLACGALDDIAVALTGLHPKDVWLTRLEGDLPRLALAHDLALTPAAGQTSVTNYMQAATGINDQGLCPTSVAPLSFFAPPVIGNGTGGGGRHNRDRERMVGYALLALLVAGSLGRRMARPRVQAS